MEAHQTSNLGVLGSSPSKVGSFFININEIDEFTNSIGYSTLSHKTIINIVFIINIKYILTLKNKMKNK